MSKKTQNPIPVSLQTAFNKEIEQSNSKSKELEEQFRNSYYEVLKSLEMPNTEKQVIILCAQVGGLLASKRFPPLVGDILGTGAGVGILITANLIDNLLKKAREQNK